MIGDKWRFMNAVSIGMWSEMVVVSIYLHFCLLTDFYWVQDNPGTVEVHLFNPLPLELKITNFVRA